MNEDNVEDLKKLMFEMTNVIDIPSIHPILTSI